MKIYDIIEKVSELYREEREKMMRTRAQLNVAEQKLSDVHHGKGEDITFREYEELIKRKTELEKEFEAALKFTDGIFEAREVLMDLGFDTEVKK